MSEHARTLLDDLDTIFVGDAPVAHLLSGGRAAKRRKRRALVAGGAVAMPLAVGGGSLALQGIPGSTEGRDTTPVMADPAASDLRVLVDMDVPKRLSTLLDGQEGEVAIWDPAERTLAFVPDIDYSGSCPPLATAESTASEAVTLIVRGDPDTGPCRMDARQVTVSITGLITAPPDLTVTVSGETHTIPVQSPSTQSIPTRLDCRGRGLVSTDGGLLAAGATAKGADTPELAVEAFLSAMELARYDYVVDGAEAWVLRSDGTAVARVNFLLRDGWTIHGYSLWG